MHQKVRVIGGAYGAFCQLGQRSGTVQLLSYVCLCPQRASIVSLQPTCLIAIRHSYKYLHGNQIVYSAVRPWSLSGSHIVIDVASKQLFPICCENIHTCEVFIASVQRQHCVLL